MTGNGFDGGVDTRMNLVIVAATEFVDDVLDQVHMVYGDQRSIVSMDFGQWLD